MRGIRRCIPFYRVHRVVKVVGRKRNVGKGSVDYHIVCQIPGSPTVDCDRPLRDGGVIITDRVVHLGVEERILRDQPADAAVIRIDPGPER